MSKGRMATATVSRQGAGNRTRMEVSVVFLGALVDVNDVKPLGYV